jgi:hypothetical protein
VQRAARALVGLGVQPGQTVCILGFNRPEWLVMDHAAMMVGATSAGIYWTSAPVEVAYILQHSRAPLLLLEDAGQHAKLQASGAALPQLRHVVSMGTLTLPGCLDWQGFLALGDEPEAERLQAEVERRLAALRLSDLGSLIYTSGTTGHPKAVMLSHGNLAWTAQTLNRVYAMDERGRLISYLPMAHVAEKVGAIHAPARAGNAIYFARAIEQLLEHMKEVRPTVYFGVPRLWEKMHAALAEKLGAARGVKGAMARWAMGVARRWHERQLAAQAPGVLLDARMALARRLVLRKVHAALGSGRGDPAAVERRTDLAPGAEVLLLARPAGARALRSERGLRAHHAEPERRHARRFGRPADRRTDPAHRRRRRGAGAQPWRVPGLRRRRGGQRRGAAGRLAAQRRPGSAGRRRLPLHHRAQEGSHHHLGRQEHLAGQSGKRPDGPAADRACGGGGRGAALPRRAADPEDRRAAGLRRARGPAARGAGSATRACCRRCRRRSMR